MDGVLLTNLQFEDTKTIGSSKAVVTIENFERNFLVLGEKDGFIEVIDLN